jgi:hypothetical protein
MQATINITNGKRTSKDVLEDIKSLAFKKITPYQALHDFQIIQNAIQICEREMKDPTSPIRSYWVSEHNSLLLARMIFSHTHHIPFIAS